jgi:hypothetical protein
MTATLLAAGGGLHWHGIDGWLYFLAAVSFALAILATFVSWRHVTGRAILFIALGLLLWVLTYIITS